MEKAGDDERAATDLLNLGHVEISAFHAQQAAEKALKAAQISKLGRFDRTHDLVLLCRSLKAPAVVEGHAAVLSQYYVASRYPDAPGGITGAEASQALSRCAEVIRWARTQTS